MKRLKNIFALAAVTTLFTIILPGCEKVNEVPPEVKSIREVKIELPKATPLSQDENAKISAIREEYNKNK